MSEQASTEDYMADYVPRWNLQTSREQRSALKDEVAAIIIERLTRDPTPYIHTDVVAGLGKLVSEVANATGWSRADVYTALRRVDGVDINLGAQTITLADRPLAIDPAETTWNNIPSYP